ncbi:MAG TPA: PD-(D/E)XK nuclease family protein, partial [Planctomycetota bacterium]|nr:PD-(D/E)XK nuclease family protein [Planctomycetota bacterium]
RLRVRPLEAPEDDALVDAREIGDLVHVALERLYADLPWSRGEEPVGAAARERLAAEVAELARRLARGRLRAFPAVARALARTWGAALERFVLADVHDLAARGARSIARENAFEGLLPTSIGPIALRARIDRVVRLADGSEEVADYKTGRIGDLAKPLEAARGRRLQLALYAFAREVETGRLPRASALRIHPDATEPEIESLAPDALGGARGAIETALGVLATLSRDGVFPLASHDSACRHCRWRRACRRSHAPTRARNFAAAAHAAYVALAKATLAAAKEET